VAGLLLAGRHGASGPGAVEAATGAWTGQYWNNTTLSGTRVLQRTDGSNPVPSTSPVLDMYWEGSPGPGVNADGWSARWTRTDTYPASTYRFTAVTDDGMRVFVDNVLIIDAWFDQPPTTYFADYSLGAGSHTLKVEFYDAANAATAQLTVQDVSTLPPGWTGQYYASMDLSGSPAFTRNDGQDINFDWGGGSPNIATGFPADGFSVRWTRDIAFNDGVYQFTTTSDDGSRVFVDGQIVLNAWQDQPPTTTSANRLMSAGTHTVTVEYYENGGGAMMQFSYLFRPDLGGFVTDAVVSGLNQPTAFTFAPDGRIFIGLKDGNVRIVKNGALLSTPFYTVSPVNNFHDRGLLGIALDPNFMTNGYVYIAYTYDNNPSVLDAEKVAQVIRVTANFSGGVPGDTANPASKLVLLGSFVGTAAKPSCEDWPTTNDCIASDSESHTVGNLKFGPDGKLYVATGDGASFSTVDPLALRSLDINRLNGKILRVNPANGQGLPDNPFTVCNPTCDLNATRSKVWAIGVRNDFRFNFKPGTNVMFSGDVGWDTTEEINVVTPGVNLGWPCYEGLEQNAGYAAYATCQSLYAAGGVTFPLHYWYHPPNSASVGGAFTGANTYSTKYQNTYFFGDYARNEINVLKVDASNSLVPNSTELFSSTADGPVDIEIGPDGDVYYLSILTGEVRHIRYIGDNRPPTAAITATPSAGLAPLTVNFSSAGSSDPDPGQTISFDWDFGDGSPHSSAANPTHQYTTNGNRTVVLTVTDQYGLSATATKVIQVGNTPPVATIAAPADNAHYDIGDVINFSGSGSDAQDGALAPASLAWSVIMVHCTDGTYTSCHTHTHVTASGTSGSFAIPDHGDFVYYQVFLTATDSGGLTDTKSVTLTANTVDLTFASNRAGVQLTVDGSSQTVPFTRTVPRKSVHTLYAPSPQTAGGTPVQFSAWSDAGAQQHTVTANAGATYTATYVDLPTPTPTPTATPTRTNTPTATPTPTATNTPTPTNTPGGPTPTPCNGDADCDGVLDSVDNCPTTANPSQENSNGETLVLGGGLADDATNPLGTTLGDACNPDVDADRLTLPGESAAGTSPTNFDTDGDTQLDGAEIACGSNPLDSASKVTGADADGDGLPDTCEVTAGTNPNVTDTDGDGLADGVEFLRLGTSPTVRDSDGDGCNDSVEVASVNGDRIVSAADLGIVATHFGVGGSGYVRDYDPNRDGLITAGDLGFIASRFGPCVP
jgi:glucose/arabinose dehydrogenase